MKKFSEHLKEIVNINEGKTYQSKSLDCKPCYKYGFLVYFDDPSLANYVTFDNPEDFVKQYAFSNEEALELYKQCCKLKIGESIKSEPYEQGDYLIVRIF